MGREGYVSFVSSNIFTKKNKIYYLEGICKKKKGNYKNKGGSDKEMGF